MSAFKINDGWPVQAADVTVDKGSTTLRGEHINLKIEIPGRTEQLTNGVHKAVACLQPHAARAIADALRQRAQEIEPETLKWNVWPSPAPKLADLVQGGQVNEEFRRMAPGEAKSDGFGVQSRKTWDNSYTKRVSDAVERCTVRGYPIAHLSSSIRDALALLKDYWESMHKIYEDRDSARSRLKQMQKQMTAPADELAAKDRRISFWKAAYDRKVEQKKEAERERDQARAQATQLKGEVAHLQAQLQETQRQAQPTVLHNTVGLRRKYKRGDTVVLNPGMLLHVMVSKDATLHVTQHAGAELVTRVTGT